MSDISSQKYWNAAFGV